MRGVTKHSIRDTTNAMGGGRRDCERNFSHTWSINGFSIQLCCFAVSSGTRNSLSLPLRIVCYLYAF